MLTDPAPLTLDRNVIRPSPAEDVYFQDNFSSLLNDSSRRLVDCKRMKNRNQERFRQTSYAGADMSSVIRLRESVSELIVFEILPSASYYDRTEKLETGRNFDVNFHKL
jgi:hypothetical protein